MKVKRKSSPRVPLNEAGERKCTKCDNWYPWVPKKYLCDECLRIKNREAHRRRHPGHKRDLYLRRTYGITLKEFGELIVEQGEKCAICHAEFWATYDTDFSPPKLRTYALSNPSRGDAVVDHEVTPEGKVHVRGALCMQCNRGLGHFGDGDLEMLERALQYIKDRSHNS